MEGDHDAHILTDPVQSAACPKCGAMLEVVGLAPFTVVQCPACQFEFQVPARFGNFMLLQLLGAGGMGGVYRARDEGLNREVAIKVMLKSLGDDPQFVETFQREAQAAARLNHPNIAQIYSFGQEKGQPYIVMELVSGGSLDRMMAEQGPLDPTVVMHVGAQVAEGLREAADAGLVHGDVKPENILFDNDKNAKLVDFGLASMASGPGNDVWGTPYYIAPEKVRRQKSDFRSDIYSLGGTLYHAIAGVPPFEGADATAVVKARFDGPPKPISEIRGKIPEDVEQIIARMLEVEPGTRYPTYGSLLGDMRRYLAKAGPVHLTSSSKKIMLKGKRAGASTGKMNTSGGMAMTGAMNMTGTVATTGELPSGMVPVDQVEAEPAKRDYKKMAMIGGGVAVLVLVLVGGIVGGTKYSKTQKAKAEQAVVVKKQANANALIAKTVAKARTKVEALRALVPQAMEYPKAAADAVVAVLGEEVRASLVPPEPAAAEAQPAAPADPNQVAAASNAVPAQAAAEPAAAAPAAEGGAPAHPAVALVRGMYENAYSVKLASQMADSLLAEVEAQAKGAEKLTKPEQLNDLIRLANSLVDKVAGIGYIKEIENAPRLVAKLRKTLDEVKENLATLAEQKRRETLEKEKKAKADEAEQKRIQEQDALKEKAKGEVEKVRSTEVANASALKQLQFREALRTIKDLNEEVTTQQGQDAVALALDRVNRIKDFHAYLVEKVPGFKSARGWSIDSADPKSLSVGGHKIQWVEVYEKRLDIVGELINTLVVEPAATKNLRLREKTRLMTNAALCLNLFYKEVPSAQERAKALANDAAKQFDVDADIIKQLLPEFFQ